jgi:hypothetical protein
MTKERERLEREIEEVFHNDKLSLADISVGPGASGSVEDGDAHK